MVKTTAAFIFFWVQFLLEHVAGKNSACFEVKAGRVPQLLKVAMLHTEHKRLLRLHMHNAHSN